MRNINQKEAFEILKKNKIHAVKTYAAKNEKELLKIFKDIRKPVALKIISEDIVHKSDSGCLKININDEKSAVSAYKEIINNAKKQKAKIEGILIQEMTKGNETIIGVKKDPQFGNVIAFGLGGIFVEVMKDVSLRVCPINKKDAEEMISEIKGKKILEGYRGGKPANKKDIIDILVKVSDMVEKNPKIMELDLNPVIVNEKSATVVDARILYE